MKIKFNDRTKASITELVNQSNIIQQRINDFVKATIEANDVEVLSEDKVTLSPDLSGVEIVRDVAENSDFSVNS